MLSDLMLFKVALRRYNKNKQTNTHTHTHTHTHTPKNPVFGIENYLAFPNLHFI